MADLVETYFQKIKHVAFITDVKAYAIGHKDEMEAITNESHEIIKIELFVVKKK